MDFDQIIASKTRVLDEELRELSAEEVDLAGISLGGIMAAHMAMRYGDRVRNLVTAFTPGTSDTGLFKLGVGFAVTEAGANARLVKEQPHDLGSEITHYE